MELKKKTLKNRFHLKKCQMHPIPEQANRNMKPAFLKWFVSGPVYTLSSAQTKSEK